MHLVGALTHMKLNTTGAGRCVSFVVNVDKQGNGKKMSVLGGPGAADARKAVAEELLKRRGTKDCIITKLRSTRTPDDDCALMQQLHDAGIVECPMSGLPVFNPSELPEGVFALIKKVLRAIATCTDAKPDDTEKAHADMQAAVMELLAAWPA